MLAEVPVQLSACRSYDIVSRSRQLIRSSSRDVLETLLGRLRDRPFVRITHNTIRRTHACVDRGASGPNGQLSQRRRTDPVDGGSAAEVSGISESVSASFSKNTADAALIYSERNKTTNSVLLS